MRLPCYRQEWQALLLIDFSFHLLLSKADSELVCVFPFVQRLLSQGFGQGKVLSTVFYTSRSVFFPKKNTDRGHLGDVRRLKVLFSRSHKLVRN